MPENPAPFAAMPGFEGMAPMGVPGQMGVPDFGQQDEEFKRQQREQEEAARKQQADMMLKDFIQSRKLTADELRTGALEARGTAPIGINIDSDESGVHGLGGALKIPFSPRIGLTVGGGYAMPTTQQQQVMGQEMEFKTPGQLSGTVQYNSPFINVNFRHTGKRGFEGSMGGRATW
jgi:hypothetical protein